MRSWWSNPSANDAYNLAIVSLVVTLVAAVGGLIAYKILEDSLLFVYGLENCVDFISSAIVVWRFNKPGNADSRDSQARKFVLEAREKRAEVGIAFVLLLLGFGSIVVAARDFFLGFEELKEKHLWTLNSLALASLVVFGTLALFKFRYSDALNSTSLYMDGICSLIGTCLALSLFFNNIFSFSTGGKLWWLDPAVALTCGIASLIYGLYSLYLTYVKEGLPIFRREWWIYSAKENGNQPNENPNTSPDISPDTNPDTGTTTKNENLGTPNSLKLESSDGAEMTTSIP